MIEFILFIFSVNITIVLIEKTKYNNIDGKINNIKYNYFN